MRRFIEKFYQVVIPCLRMLKQTFRLVTDSLCKIPVSGFQRCPSLAVVRVIHFLEFLEIHINLHTLNFKTACNVKCTSPMPLPHSPPASGLAVRDSLACETKSNQLRCCCIQGICASSVFHLLPLVALVFFLFLIATFSHRIDNIIKSCGDTATPKGL